MNNKILVTLAVMVGTIVGTGSLAFASTVPADPTGGAMQDTQDSIITWVVTLGAPFLFALVLLGILVRLGVKWLRRGAAKV